MKRTLSLMSAVVILASSIMTMSCAQNASPRSKTDTAKAGMSTATVSDTSKLKPQTTCPVMGGPIDKKLFVDYKGKRIYVCCKDCLAAVTKSPEKYIKKLESEGQSVETIGSPAVDGYYTCPMHPQIHQSQPGKCPICGMTLVQKTEKATDAPVKKMGMKGDSMTMDHGKMKM